MLLLLAALALQDPLSADDAAKLHAQLAPPKDEPWRAIPWRLSMLDARDAATKEKKPVFLWSMNGHPLGCV
jgi:hypothetical protein